MGKWISGEANVKDWKPSDNDPNAGIGHYGICCNEMDIWESNKHDQAFTPHTCKPDGYKRCEGTDCGDNGDDRYKGLCDKDGGDLVEIKRFYVQDGRVIRQPFTNIPNLKGPQFNSLTDATCAAQKEAMGDKNDFAAKGGMKKMG